MNIKDLMRKDIDIIMLGEDKTQRETDKDEAVPINGANIYLSLDVLFSDSHINPIEGLSLGVYVTNLNTVHRYFNQPIFKISTQNDDGVDTFGMTNRIGKIIEFPKRLEYGESFSVNYKLSSVSISDFFEKILKKDGTATIKTFAKTSLGETFYSNEYPISKIVNIAKEIKII